MADYQDIRGLRVKYLSADPSTSTLGEVWYNSTSGTLKATVMSTAAWSSGTALPSVRWQPVGTGIKTAALLFGGSTGPGWPTFLNTTFEGDGSSWTAGGTNPLARIGQFGAGTQTATIGGGGYSEAPPYPPLNSSVANTYNGTSWTGITATPFESKAAGTAGTTTAALIYGSDISPSDNQDSYSWNGVAWAEEGALNSNFQSGGSGGNTENTAFASGSLYSPSPNASDRFETYNGTAWANGPAMVTPQYQNRGFGSSTECLSIGGYDKVTTVQKFDGSSWAAAPSLATGRKNFASSNFGASGITNGWVGGGSDGTSAVEDYSAEVAENQTLTTS